jgi:AmmeMemoRadiSam system protein B
MEWYPQNKAELQSLIEKLMKSSESEKSSKSSKETKEIHGLIVPHAGYEFSGEIAGKAFAMLKKQKKKKVIILGPSHSIKFFGVKVLDKKETPLGKIKIIESDYEQIDYEHSVDNELPFLQKLGFEEFLPLVIGDLDNQEAEKIAKEISDIDAIYIFSTDLSHFHSYKNAMKQDKKTIRIIEKLDIMGFKDINACGQFPLLIFLHLCKIKGWKPELVEYKNSGDITPNKNSVVGYASFSF